MGLWNYIKKKYTVYKYARMMNGYSPIFTQFGDNIYASDIVQSVIMCIVTEMSKLKPMHIKKDGRDSMPINDSIQRVLEAPNEIMTTSDFISKIMWNLFLNYNSLIYPVYEETENKDGSVTRKYIALYPLQPTTVTFQEDRQGNLYVNMRFNNGYETTLPYESLIHIKYKYSINDFMGGNAQGQPDNEALLKLLQMNNNLMEGVINAMKTSYNINGLLKHNQMLDGAKMQKSIEEFNNQLQNNFSGILGVDLKSEYIPIKRDIKMIDSETLEFIDKRILRQFGVSLPILTGDYTKEQYEAFYQKTLEPLIINISQAFRKTLFTKREKDLGHDITFMPEDLIFLNTSQVLEAIRLLGDSGTLYENEKRVAIGLPPDPDLVGVRMMSLNYINAELAPQYQAVRAQTQKTSKVNTET